MQLAMKTTKAFIFSIIGTVLLVVIFYLEVVAVTTIQGLMVQISQVFVFLS